MRYAYPADLEEAGDGITATFAGLPGATFGAMRWPGLGYIGAMDGAPGCDPGQRRPQPEWAHTPYRLVIVEWEDSQRPLAGWQWLDEYTLPEAVRCVSVGFLVAESDAAIALAPNLGDLDLDRPQGCGIIRIPRSAMRRVQDL